MKVLYSWIREFVDVPDTAEALGRRLSLRGLALEGLEPWPDGSGDDAVLDFDVTANRPDCLSMAGIAREIATVYDLPLRTPAAEARQSSESQLTAPHVPVNIDAPELCARYVAAVAEVEVGPSPAWMQARLTACGVRPISNIVDITNYVLLELGQPMHAFDLDRLAGPAICVRRARAGEILKTLDGKTRTLAPDTLVIADADRAQAVGGVMGGADSEVNDQTRRIVFESAWFKPGSVRATSKRLGLRTEASIRFERGADLTASARALARACELLVEVGAGRAWGHVEDVYPRPHQSAELSLERPSIKALLGMEVPDSSVVRILRSLGFAVVETVEGWRVTVPGWRVDIQHPVDLIEELGRHHGFEHLPTTFPAVQQAPPESDPRIARDQRIRGALLASGFSEAITFAFVEEAAAAPFLNGAGPVALANPLSEKFAVMRPSLLPGLIDAVSHNRRHGMRDVRLFEIGTRFSASAETRSAGMAWTGLATPDHWSGGRRDVNFFDIKGVIEQTISLTSATPTFVAVETPVLVSGRAARVEIDGQSIGVLGQLAPERAEARQLPAADPIYVAEIDLDALTRLAPDHPIRSKPLPRFPSVVRDVSILVDDSLSAETVRGTIRAAAPATLVHVREFDRYQGKGIPDGKVSVSLRLTFQSPDRTLTDDEVQTAMNGIVATLTTKLGAIQR